MKVKITQHEVEFSEIYTQMDKASFGTIRFKDSILNIAINILVCMCGSKSILSTKRMSAF